MSNLTESVAAILREDGIHCRVADSSCIDCWSQHMRWWVQCDGQSIKIGLYLEAIRKPWHAHFNVADPDVFRQVVHHLVSHRPNDYARHLL